mmetsp:Transcript_9241/g.17376  ORF Transcript_9241/g.17376 Transcript_9241/m.17376 type:complete len:83 (+) Transcript_9241:1517-1765(+)
MEQGGRLLWADHHLPVHHQERGEGLHPRVSHRELGEGLHLPDPRQWEFPGTFEGTAPSRLKTSGTWAADKEILSDYAGTRAK